MPVRLPSRQTSITLSHPESEDEEEEEMEEEVRRESDKDDESLHNDTIDGGSLSTGRGQRRSSSSSSGSFEEMLSPSPDESLENTSTMSEDVDELESSLDQSLNSSLKQRSGYIVMSDKVKYLNLLSFYSILQPIWPEMYTFSLNKFDANFLFIYFKLCYNKQGWEQTRKKQ